MAALKEPAGQPARTARAAAARVAAASPGAAPSAVPGVAPDPRAVRVSLAPASATAGLEPLEVGPAGDPDGATLRRLDRERAVLSRPGRPPERLLLLPPEPARDRRSPARREIVVAGWRIEVEIEGAARAALRERARRDHAVLGRSGPTEVRAIIPGVVVSVSVTAGDEVVAGQQLLAVEAMKMQNELRAPRDGVIERVAVGQGTTIEVGDLLLVIA